MGEGGPGLVVGEDLFEEGVGAAPEVENWILQRGLDGYDRDHVFFGVEAGFGVFEEDSGAGFACLQPALSGLVKRWGSLPGLAQNGGVEAAQAGRHEEGDGQEGGSDRGEEEDPERLELWVQGVSVAVGGRGMGRRAKLIGPGL